MDAPKLFVSYSWTSPDHEAWVLSLATELRESGVEVILDKWDLKEGHDAYAFMEKMVTDPEIKKVILICDEAYVKKADKRTGGVGTEAQIISGEIYAKSDQSKFVAIVKERDVEGKAYLPAYYKSRIYIDLSDPTTYSTNSEQLLRWIYDQPFYQKPELGKKPAFLSEMESSISLGTTARFKRAVEAIKNSRAHADGATAEYLSVLSTGLENLRIEGRTCKEDFDDEVVKSIDLFLPYRNEAIELFQTIAQYRDSAESRKILHRFLENIIPYLDRPPHITSYKDGDLDNFRFIVHELFLYAVASLIQHERFEFASYLMRNQYYIPGQSEYGQSSMVPFEVFRRPMKLLKYRNQRLGLNRLSLRADFLEQRCKGLPLTFRHVMQADFVLFIRDHLDSSDVYFHWWPETLLYISRFSGPLEIFARSRSRAYFDQVKVLFGIKDEGSLESLVQAFEAGKRQLPTWEAESFNPRAILGLNELATAP
jgi:hypothetical protein